MLADHAGFLARGLDHSREFSADGIGEGDVSHHATAEKSIDAMARSIEKLIGNDEIQRLMFFLQRTDRRDRNDSLNSKLLEAVNVGAKIQLAGQDAMTESMSR